MIYVKSLRYGRDSFSKHEGMDLETVVRLLNEIGATDVQEISQEEFEIGYAK